jgi:hypothetical protein
VQHEPHYNIWINPRVVILSGEGADEVAQGYFHFHKAPSGKEADEASRRHCSNLHYLDVLPAHCHLLGFSVTPLTYNDVIFSQLAQGIHFSSCQYIYIYIRLTKNIKCVPENYSVLFGNHSCQGVLLKNLADGNVPESRNCSLSSQIRR